jgi:hypothetical protein
MTRHISSRYGFGRKVRPPDGEGNRKMTFSRSAAGLALAALALAGCENIPYYDESLDLFSRSRYRDEIEAIERRTPPPEPSPVLSAPKGAAMADPIGGAEVLAAVGPEVGPAAQSGAAAGPTGSQDLSAAGERAITPATVPPRTRITPFLGFGRSKRVIYGANRGPFATGNGRAPL